MPPKRAALLEWVCREWTGPDDRGGDVVETSSIKSLWRENKRGRDMRDTGTRQQSPEDDCEMARLPDGKRHLCDKGCFFWEYEAARSLAMLRTRLSEQGVCLSACQGWSARIERGCKGSGRRVVYQSACGQVYATSRSALSALLELGRSTKRSRINSSSSSSSSCSSSSSSSSSSSPPPPNYQEEILQGPQLCLKSDQRQRVAKKSPFFRGVPPKGSPFCFVRPPTWEPPASPFGLLEELLWKNPWQLLVGCMLLNQTNRRKVDAILYRLFQAYPTEQDMAEACTEDVERIIKPLGLQKRRSCGIIRMSLAYVKGAWRHPGDLPGIGKYASDAYSLFVTGTWKQDTSLEARPTDYALLLYRSYLDSIEKGIGANGETTGRATHQHGQVKLEVCMDRAGDTIV